MALTPASYVVLALLDGAGEATPYELKKMAASFADLYALRHDQVYREPERLAKDGLVTEQREETGRRRRRFSLTKKGRAALAEWLATPTVEFTELRDAGLLQLLLGADSKPLAAVQLAAHQDKLAEYEQLAGDLGPDAPAQFRRALNAGIGHEREWVRYWSDLAKGGDGL